MNRRLIGVVAAVALAAIGTFVLVSYVRTAEERAIAGEASVNVLVVTRPVARGTPAEDLGSSVKSLLVPAKVQAPGSVASLDDIEGRVAAVDLVPGEQLLTTRFVATEVLETQTKVEIPDGLLQVTISLSPDRAVGGQLRPGSTVALLSSFEPFDIGGAEPADGSAPTEDTSTSSRARTPSSTHLVLHKLLVTNVQAEELPAEPDEDSGSSIGLAPTGNLLVTVAVTASDAEKVVFTAEHGTVWLAIEPAGAPEDGTQIQTRGTVYR